jgi:hypothetical protein
MTNSYPQLLTLLYKLSFSYYGVVCSSSKYDSDYPFGILKLFFLHQNLD